MEIQSTRETVQRLVCDALIIGVVSSKHPAPLSLSEVARSVDGQLDGLLNERYTDGEFHAHHGELLTLYPHGRLAAKRVLIVGLGTREKLTPQAIRRASAIAIRHAQRTGAHTTALALYGAETYLDAAQSIQAEVEGALLGAYTFRQYQTSRSEQKISQLQILTRDINQALLDQAIRKGEILAEAANFARDLVNEPPNVLTPGELAERTRAMAQRYGLECEVFDKDRIAEYGMGGLLGVAQGSALAPYFIVLRYRDAAASDDKGLALVGKGITFDTGGISLKPASNMDGMKGDMGGAAAVIGAMQAIAQLKPAGNVTALIPTCENMPSGTAYRPGDILRIANGKTIEIVNTDAEGRLILADALSYAVKNGLSPIIDLATLTGGIVVALGSIRTGLFSNDDRLRDEILHASEVAGEKFWPMPLDDEYGDMIKSDIADVKQTGGREASAVTAAKVLENFVGETAWAHLDIAGTSYLDNRKAYQEKGATGVGVRTLAELALQHTK